MKRFKKGDIVMTPYGKGEIVGIDLPTAIIRYIDPRRWMVLITEPIKGKHHMNTEKGEPLCFRDDEVKEIEGGTDGL